MQLVCLDGYTLNPGDNPWNDIEQLGEFTVYDRTPAQLIVERARNADIILTNKTLLSAQTLDQLPKLKFIAVLATGFNVVDVQAARKRNIPVTNVPEYGTDSVAQHIFAVLLNHCHQPALHDAAIRNGKWHECGDFCFWQTPLIELAGKTMGIVGFGRIGKRVAELAHAFGMKVSAYDVNQPKSANDVLVEWKSIEALFAESDVISLHCPLTQENTGLINNELIHLMKPTALLINAARGGLVNENDLAVALNSERIAGACLDVLGVEPIDKNNPLLTAKNCLITPHIAWATVAARKRLMATVAQNIEAFIEGKPINVVN